MTQSDFCFVTDQKLGDRNDCHLDLGSNRNSSRYSLKVFRRRNGRAGVVLWSVASSGELGVKG